MPLLEELISKSNDTKHDDTTCQHVLFSLHMHFACYCIHSNEPAPVSEEKQSADLRWPFPYFRAFQQEIYIKRIVAQAASLKNSCIKIILVRHGPSQGNSQHLCPGIPLTAIRWAEDTSNNIRSVVSARDR